MLLALLRECLRKRTCWTSLAFMDTHCMPTSTSFSWMVRFQRTSPPSLLQARKKSSLLTFLVSCRCPVKSELRFSAELFSYVLCPICTSAFASKHSSNSQGLHSNSYLSELSSLKSLLCVVLFTTIKYTPKIFTVTHAKTQTYL